MNENAILHVDYKFFIIIPLQIRIFQSFFVWMVSLELSWQKDGHCKIETIIITMTTPTLCAIPWIHNCIWAVHTVLLYMQLWSQSKHSKWYQRKKKWKQTNDKQKSTSFPLSYWAFRLSICATSPLISALYL